MMSNHSYTLHDLMTLMARLREPVYGCPWDLAQTWESITPSTIEEAYEVVDAIEQQDFNQVKDELGDLLFQVIFYGQLAKEAGLFDFNEIVSAITAKLLRRHPHVFPDGTLESRCDPEQRERDKDAIKASWERIKQQERSEKGHQSLLDDVPGALPAMTRAVKLQKRAASVGFDWPDSEGVYHKLQEEITELQQAETAEDREEELGDLLFTVVNLARHLQIEPEQALRRVNNKFQQRFQSLEARAQKQQQPLEEQSTDVLERWWQLSKL